MALSLASAFRAWPFLGYYGYRHVSHWTTLMSNASEFSSPAPMEGHGVYNRSSRVQAAGLSPAVPVLERAAGTVPLTDTPEAIVIADYGSSEGRNSLVPMAIAIRRLRDRVGPDRAISVVHTDLPGNDFNAMFETLANDPDSYLRDDPNAFASAVGRNDPPRSRFGS
jgi:SAM dependent carboxyl methyltransferase